MLSERDSYQQPVSDTSTLNNNNQSRGVDFSVNMPNGEEPERAY